MPDQDLEIKYNIIPNILLDWLIPYIEFGCAKILDFGCGNAIIAMALAKKYPNAQIYAIDLNTSEQYCLSSGIEKFGIYSIPDNLHIYEISASEKIDFGIEFDLIYSWSSLEHLAQDIFKNTISQLYRILKNDGYLFTQIAPLYYSPFGSHISHLLPRPWVHLILQKNLFYEELRKRCASIDYFREMCSLYNTLNMITTNKLAYILKNTGFSEIREYFTYNQICDDISKLIEADPEIEFLFEIYAKDVLLTEQAVYLHKE